MRADREGETLVDTHLEYHNVQQMAVKRREKIGCPSPPPGLPEDRQDSHLQL